MSPEEAVYPVKFQDTVIDGFRFGRIEIFYPPLLSFCRVPRSRKEIAQFLGIKTSYYVTQHYIRPLVEAGKLKMTIPDSPGSPRQKYYAG